MRSSRIRRAVLAICVAAAGGAAVPAPAASVPASSEFVPGRVLVKFASGARPSQRRAALAAVGGVVERRIPVIGTSVVRLSAGAAVIAAARRLSSRAGVEYAEPDYVGHVALLPQDPCIGGCDSGRQWDVGAVNALGGWDVAPGRFFTQAQKRDTVPAPVKVAVLDTAIDTTMQDWINAEPGPISAAFDAANGGQIDTADAADHFVSAADRGGSAAYHGTFVAGILGAAANNAHGIAGFAYSAQIMPVEVVDGAGRTKASGLSEGILWAWEHGARVLNLSLGLTEYSQTVQAAIAAVTTGTDTRPGSLVVAAAGNNANDAPFYPAQMRGVLSVSAVDEADRPGTCTNHNASVGVAAPGVGIVSLDPRTPSGFSTGPCGTSTATPHVSALAALLFAQVPGRTPSEVSEIIKRNADDVNAVAYPGRDDYYGSGRVNFERALKDGIGPVVDRVAASFPRAVGGSSEVTATGTARSAVRPIQAVEWFLDLPGSPGSGFAAGQRLDAADGVFNSAVESLRGQILVPLNIPTGVHRLFVRAFDGVEWGACSVGPLIVDRTPPRLSAFEVTPVVVPVQEDAATITFDVSDDYAATATYSFTVVRDLVGTNEVVYQSAPVTVSLPASAVAYWNPQVTDVGSYTIQLTVGDEAGNPARGMVSTVVL
ncbi:MAG: S8 family serine peptidase [Actinomycetota bacterium]